MGKVNVTGREHVIGQEAHPFSVAGFALAFPFDLPQAQKAFLSATNSGAKPDVFFAMVWTHTAVHLEFHTQELGKLVERVALLESAVDQMVNYVADDAVKMLPPPLALDADHKLASALTKKGGPDVGIETPS